MYNATYLKELGQEWIKDPGDPMNRAALVAKLNEIIFILNHHEDLLADEDN